MGRHPPNQVSPALPAWVRRSLTRGPWQRKVALSAIARSDDKCRRSELEECSKLGLELFYEDGVRDLTEIHVEIGTLAERHRAPVPVGRWRASLETLPGRAFPCGSSRRGRGRNAHDPEHATVAHHHTNKARLLVTSRSGIVSWPSVLLAEMATQNGPASDQAFGLAIAYSGTPSSAAGGGR